MTQEIQKIIHENIKSKLEFLNQAENIEKAANKIVEAIKNGNKILIFGNGGSAADSQHIAGELIGKFKLDRMAIPAIALTTDSSILTALSNDFGFSSIFERQVEALAKKGDILLGISTSGNSENVIKAFEKGKLIGTINISLTGKDGGKIKEISDININSFSTDTPRIQECHILAYHILCELVEKQISTINKTPKESYDSLTISGVLSNQTSETVEKSRGLATLNRASVIFHDKQPFENLSLEYKNPAPVKIGNKLIGHNQPIYVIAELGINHNGDINIAKKLIDMAVQVGCDAVKFQKRTIDLVYSPEELAKPRESPFGDTNGDLKRGLEFDENEYREIDRYCKEKGIGWFASAWDIPSVDFLEKFNPPCHKIASACLTNKDLLLKIKSTGRPIILSTGMSTMEEISKAVNLLGEENLIILHCTTTYPTDPKEHDINAIKTFRKLFNCPIGYSGHESGIGPTIVAASIGACVLERHITLDRSMYGSDQAASLEKEGLMRVCREAKFTPIYLGQDTKRVFDSEKPIIDKLRKIKTL